MRLRLLRTTDPLVSLLTREFDIIILTIEPALSTLAVTSYIYDLLTESRIYDVTVATLMNNSLLVRDTEVDNDLGNEIKKSILNLSCKLPDLTDCNYKDTVYRLPGIISKDMMEFSSTRYKKYLTNYSIKESSRTYLGSVDIESLEIPELQDLIRMLEISNKHYPSSFLRSLLSEAIKLRESP
jgi:hypothetical protein